MPDLPKEMKDALEEQAQIWTTEMVPRLEEMEKLAKGVADKANAAATGHGDLQAAIEKVNERLDEYEQVGAVKEATVKTTGEGTLSTGFGDYTRGRKDANAAKLSMDAETGGAVLAPAEFVARISEIQRDMVLFRQYAEVIPTSHRALEISRAGEGDQPAWEEDDFSPRPLTGEPGFSLDTIQTHGQYYRLFIGNMLLEDSAIDMEPWVAQRAARKFALQEGEAFITGNGVGKPEGVMASSALLAAAISTTGPALLAGDIIDLAFSLPQVYANLGTFIMERTFLGAVRKFRDADGAFLWQPALAGNPAAGNLAAGNPATILGRPYIISESATSVVTAGTGSPIMAFGDMREAYTIADRRVVSSLRDPYSTGGAGIYMHMRTRVGGQVTQPAAARILKLGS